MPCFGAIKFAKVGVMGQEPDHGTPGTKILVTGMVFCSYP
jgi:hypothetical protein